MEGKQSGWRFLAYLFIIEIQANLFKGKELFTAKNATSLEAAFSGLVCSLLMAPYKICKGRITIGNGQAPTRCLVKHQQR